MKKNIKLSIIGVSIITILLGGGLYYRFDQLQQKRDYFQDKFTKLKSMLPKSIVIDKTSESGFFETSSIYTIQIKTKDGKSSNKIVINTQLNYGLSYLMNGVIEGNSVGTLVGPVTKEFKSFDKLFNSRITILEDDTFINEISFVDLIDKDGSQSKGMTAYFESTKNDDNVKANFKLASLNTVNKEGEKPLFSMKGLDIEYLGKLNQLGNNNLNVKVAEVESAVAQAKKIAFAAHSNIHLGSIDFKSSFSIANINADQWKNGSIDFSYSIRNLDESAIQFIYNMAKNPPPTTDKDMQKGIQKAQEQIKKIFTHGFEVNVEKLALKVGEDKFNFSLKATLPNVKTFEDVNVENNLHLSSQLSTEGSFSTPVAQAINIKLQSFNNTTDSSLNKEQVTINETNQLKLGLEFYNAKATLNGKDLTPDQNDIIHIILSTIDEKLHEQSPVTKPLTNIEAKPATNIEAKPATNIEAKPATNIETKPATNIEAKPLTNIEAKPATNIEAKPATNIEAKPLTNIEAKPISIVPPITPLTKPIEATKKQIPQ